MKLEDIAKKAGVSRSTVSRVINNDPNVNAKTRERVWTVIRREDFHPNPSARALVTRRTEIIGVVIPTGENIFFTDNNYFPQLLAGMNLITRQSDYAMLLWLGELTENDDKLMRRITNNRMVDGVIVASMTVDHPLFQRLISIRNYQLVMIDRPLVNADQISYVTVDNFAAAKQMVEYLIRLGRRRIAHITGNLGIADAQDRLAGYKAALAEAGLPVDPDLIYEGHFSRQDGYAGTMRLLPHQPDAIFAAGDTIAVGVLQATREVGLDVPKHLSVVGFDDIDVAQQSFPTLTTMHQPVQKKGETAARLLIDLIEGRVPSPQHILLPTELVIRQSCGGPAPVSHVPYPTSLSGDRALQTA
jgi:LacI family transcriptional regulator